MSVGNEVVGAYAKPWRPYDESGAEAWKGQALHGWEMLDSNLMILFMHRIDDGLIVA